MASSTGPTDPVAAQALGALLTGKEAKDVADRLTAGATLTAVLQPLAPSRRSRARELLTALRAADGAALQILVLRAVQGARSQESRIDPWWTMPGHLVRTGPLTSAVPSLVDRARQSVTCSTFNVQRTSGLWAALRRAAQQPAVDVRLYLDARAADAGGGRAPSSDEVAEHLRPAAVLRSRMFDGRYVRNHAKFVAIDHRFLLVTSANFSWSAENGNVEFGVLIDDMALTESVERQMSDAEADLYEVVPPAGPEQAVP